MTLTKKERSKQYYDAHRDELVKKQRERYAKNPEKYREAMRQHRIRLELLAKRYPEESLPHESFSEFRRRVG